MRRLSFPLLLAGCLLGLVGACFGRALFLGEQFSFRDAGHFYYPLYWQVQQEWDAGRWPLWDPQENAGMPLLGNPTAAVLYPGKLIYAALPYAWGARVYIVAHVLLAFAAMAALARHWGIGRVGASIAGLSFAFGVPVLFQHANIIYLVGAAWMPLGFRGADRWLRQGRRCGILELATACTMQVLGGEPQSAYLVGLCAGGYALALAWGGRPGEARKSRGAGRWLAVGLGLTAAWTLAVLGAAAWMPRFRGRGMPVPVLPWFPYVSKVMLGAWVVAGLWLAVRWARGRDRPLRSMLGGLAGAAGLAGLLSAAQLLPVAEYTGQTVRAAEEGPHDIYPFSLEPIRLAEFVWPNVFGSYFGGNTLWINLLPPRESHPEIWTPSLYCGGLAAVLALSAAGLGPGPPWRRWMTAVAIVGFLGALGEFGGPLWYARRVPALQGVIGTPDRAQESVLRLDGQLRDGDGSIYQLLSVALPLFGSFRYPAKLLTLTILAGSALAGLGWDRVAAGPSRGLRRWALGLLGLTLAALAAAVLGRGAFMDWLRGEIGLGGTGVFGPLDPDAIYRTTLLGLAHGGAMTAILAALATRSHRRPALAGAVALAVLAVDLSLANSRYVATSPQALFDRVPRVVELIREAERADPSSGPYRIHRTAVWDPPAWRLRPSNDRVSDFVRWEHDTIQPKYGLLHDVSYTMTLGVAELFDYEWFFSAFFRRLGPEMARALKSEAGKEVVYYARRGFDLWGTRYFVLPVYPGDWTDEHRGYAAFLENTEAVYPRPERFAGPGGPEERRRWAEEEDFQILRNKNAFPRAWIVHSGRFYRSIDDMRRASRQGVMEEMLYAADSLWYDPTRTVYDPRNLGWFDQADQAALAGSLPGTPPEVGDSVVFVRQDPQRVELKATLARPGVVILSDVFFPGWTLEVDGQPAPIYRANRMMRGAALPAGEHTLVYTYEPRSFRLGALASLAGLATAVGFTLLAARRPTSPVLAG